MLLKIIMPFAVILIIVAVIIVVMALTKTSSLAEYHVADINRKKERKLNDL